MGKIKSSRRTATKPKKSAQRKGGKTCGIIPHGNRPLAHAQAQDSSSENRPNRAIVPNGDQRGADDKVASAQMPIEIGGPPSGMECVDSKPPAFDDNLDFESRPHPGDIFLLHIARLVGTQIKECFDLVDPYGFGWLGFDGTFFIRLGELTSGSPPIRVPFRVLMVVSDDDRRIEFDDTVLVKFERTEANIVFNLEGSQPVKVRILTPKLLEHELQALSIALHNERIPDSHIFVRISIDGEQYEVLDEITCGEAKAYRGPFVQPVGAA